MSTNTSPPERQFALTSDELSFWNDNGYFVRYDVFTEKENNILRQIADDIIDGKRPFPTENIDQNALVRDGKVEASGIHAILSLIHI